MTVYTRDGEVQYAKETMYRRTYFRSRMEARWAVFMDCLGVQWRYEPNPVKLPDGRRYTPDFWLPDLGYVLEVKPRELTDDETERLVGACGAYGTHGFALIGNPPQSGVYRYATETLSGWSWHGEGHFKISEPSGMSWDNFQFWTACKVCRKVGITYSGRSDYLCKCAPQKHGSVDFERLAAATKVAASHDFGGLA